MHTDTHANTFLIPSPRYGARTDMKKSDGRTAADTAMQYENEGMISLVCVRVWVLGFVCARASLAAEHMWTVSPLTLDFHTCFSFFSFFILPFGSRTCPRLELLPV